MAKADFYLYIKAKPAANTELLCFFLTLKLYGWKPNPLLGASGKNTIVLKQNSNTSKLALKENVTDIQALISKASPGTYILFHLSGTNYTGNDLPIDATYKYGSGIIFYRNSSSCKIVLFPERTKPVWKMADWEKWKDFVNNTVD